MGSTRLRGWVSIAVVTAVVGALGATVTARAASNLYVDPAGTDSGNCQTPGTPCLTIGYAVTQAAAGDTIVVAAGTYPEMVSIDKDITFHGANAGISAGVTPGVRGAESVVKGFRTSGNPGTTQRSVTIDGFQVDPQGDTTLIAATAAPLVWIYGGPATNVVNNVFVGAAAYASGCSYTCTTMTDTALELNSGAITAADNSFTNFRRTVNISMKSAVTPISSATFTRNVITNVTSRAVATVQSTGLSTMPGVSVTDNVLDATGRTGGSTPGAVIISQDSNTVTGNTITGFSSGVWVSLCRKWSTRNQTVTANTFNSNDAGIVVDDWSLTTYNGLTSQCYSLNPPKGGDTDGSNFAGNTYTGGGTGVTGWSYTRTSPAAFQAPVATASNAAPIVVTTSASNGLTTGAQITISGATGNTAANGTWTITRTNATTFSLNGSDGTSSGAYGGGGVYNILPVPALPSPAINATCSYWGSPTGPSGNGPGSGSAVSLGFVYAPWAVSPGGPCTGGTLAPSASFTATPSSGDAPLAVAFDASASSDSDGTIVSYDWDFGDSSTDSGVAASHTYTVPGTYTVTLTVTDNDGFTDTETASITVTAANVAPTASFTATPSSGTAPLAVSFDASASSDSDGTIVSYDWDFGDLSTDSGVAVSHTYTVPGTYTATLTVTDDDGATDTETATVTVTAAPVPNTKKITHIYGVATIPSTVSGDATVAFNVRSFVIFNIPLFYFGSANYYDPAAGKQANGIVLSGSVPRYGVEGAHLTAFGFGPQFKTGTVTFDIDDLSSRGLGPDTVSINAGGSLAYVNPGGTITSGDLTVLPH